MGSKVIQIIIQGTKMSAFTQKYDTIGEFLKEFDKSATAVADKLIEEDPSKSLHRYASQYGYMTGSMFGLFLALDLSDNQVKVLENYFHK